MTAWKLFPGKVAHVSTSEFHEHRERANHLEQDGHRPRLEKAAEFVRQAEESPLPNGRWKHAGAVSDLGCGDGGLLQLLKGEDFEAWGYDFAPANEAGWKERGVRAERLDVFGADRDRVDFGDITVVTEVLEHLSDPFEAVRWIGRNSEWIVASSPHDEHGKWHDECHAWAFDVQGYRALIEGGGYQIIRHEIVGRFQLILGRQK